MHQIVVDKLDLLLLSAGTHSYSFLMFSFVENESEYIIERI